MGIDCPYGKHSTFVLLTSKSNLRRLPSNSQAVHNFTPHVAIQLLCRAVGPDSAIKMRYFQLLEMFCAKNGFCNGIDNTSADYTTKHTTISGRKCSCIDDIFFFLAHFTVKRKVKAEVAKVIVDSVKTEAFELFVSTNIFKR